MHLITQVHDLTLCNHNCRLSHAEQYQEATSSRASAHQVGFVRFSYRYPLLTFTIQCEYESKYYIDPNYDLFTNPRYRTKTSRAVVEQEDRTRPSEVLASLTNPEV